ncbi:MAG: hypothetical protein AB4372_21105 [Xenococcus sp. (in: cyanobacteria)]
MKTDTQKKATINQIKPNVALRKHFLQSLSIKDLDGISGGPGDSVCPYCELEPD